MASVERLHAFARARSAITVSAEDGWISRGLSQSVSLFAPLAHSIFAAISDGFLVLCPPGGSKVPGQRVRLIPKSVTSRAASLLVRILPLLFQLLSIFAEFRVVVVLKVKNGTFFYSLLFRLPAVHYALSRGMLVRGRDRLINLLLPIPRKGNHYCVRPAFLTFLTGSLGQRCVGGVPLWHTTRT